MDNIQIMPDNPMSTLTLFDSDKKGLDYFIDYVCNTIESGMDDPLKVLAISKKMEYVTKRITDRIKENCQTAAQLHGDKPFAFMGTEMHLTTVHTKYDFSICGHPKLEDATKVKEEIETFLKALKEPMDIRVDDELVTVRPPLKLTTDGIKTTLK